MCKLGLCGCCAHLLEPSSKKLRKSALIRSGICGVDATWPRAPAVPMQSADRSFAIGSCHKKSLQKPVTYTEWQIFIHESLIVSSQTQPLGSKTAIASYMLCMQTVTTVTLPVNSFGPTPSTAGSSLQDPHPITFALQICSRAASPHRGTCLMAEKNHRSSLMKLLKRTAAAVTTVA